MNLCRTMVLIGATMLLFACDVPQPGDPDYERYQQSKADRAERLYEGF